MMNIQSWVETTVPPGYDLIRFHRKVDGKTLEAWGGCCAGDQLVGPEPRDNPAAACRDMWRHWTAAVLRGRDVRWEDDGTGSTTAWVGGVMISRYAAVVGVCNCVSVYAVSDDNHGAHVKVRDDDEAMARFAFILAGFQGPATKGDKR